MTANPWYVEGINSINKPNECIDQKLVNEMNELR